ncbi:hypothetical protein BGX27_010378 [Mortierella sp. AM989]|nr:hypothetical protein BGX27_010378 [Mortierella sp. AM989]
MDIQELHNSQSVIQKASLGVPEDIPGNLNTVQEAPLGVPEDISGNVNITDDTGILTQDTRDDLDSYFDDLEPDPDLN